MRKRNSMSGLITLTALIAGLFVAPAANASDLTTTNVQPSLAANTQVTALVDDQQSYEDATILAASYRWVCAKKTRNSAPLYAYARNGSVVYLWWSSERCGYFYKIGPVNWWDNVLLFEAWNDTDGTRNLGWGSVSIPGIYGSGTAHVRAEA